MYVQWEGKSWSHVKLLCMIPQQIQQRNW